jgi:hypothetical protein
MASGNDAEARLRRLEDLEEIRALKLEWGRRLDTKDYEGMAALFTEDGEFIAPLGTGKGHKEILAALNNRLQSIAPGYHYYCNTEATLESEDRGSMRVMFFYVQPDSIGWPKAWIAGHYDEVVRRENGRWRFEQVKITIDIGWAPYNPDAPQT